MCHVSQYIIHLVLVIFLVSVILIFHHFHDSQRGVEDYRNPSDKDFFFIFCGLILLYYFPFSQTAV